MTTSFSHTTDVIIQVPQPVPGSSAYVLKKDNISIFNNFGVLLNYPLTIGKKISTNLSHNLYRSIYSSPQQDESLNNSRSTVVFNASGQITLPKELIGELSGYYISRLCRATTAWLALAPSTRELKGRSTISV